MIREAIRAHADADVALHSQRFFKTGPGEYGEGDRFLGVRVPVLRQEARRFRDAKLRTLVSLLKSKWHEERLFAVISLADRFKRGDEARKRRIYETYCRHLDYVNNWDIVDASAHLIVGPWLESRSRRPLYQLARRKNLWHRRVAIMATYHFIRRQYFDDTLAIAEILIDDPEDLVHKAVGWMLREVGNRDRARAEKFLTKHYAKMPRTMLRYAIEKLPQSRRRQYLEGTL